MKYSLSSLVYSNYLLKDAILAIARVGYDGIDIWGGRQQAYRDDLNSFQIAEICKILNGEGLIVPSVIPAQFRYPTSLCSPLDNIRLDSVEYIKRGIDLAVAFNSPIVSICPGHTVFGQSIRDGYVRLFDSIIRICEYAEQFSIKIALEPADKYETDIISDVYGGKELAREINKDNFGIVLDTGHEHVVGNEIGKSIRDLEDKLFHFHLDDNNGIRDQHLVPGDGKIDFSGFIEAVNGLDNKEMILTAELSWDYSIDPDPAAEKTLDWLKKNLG